MIVIYWRNLTQFLKRRTTALKIVALFFLVSLSIPIHAEVWLLTHSKQQVELSAKQIRAIFSLRQKNWPDGRIIELVVMDDNNDLHKQFCLDALKLFPYQLSRIWERQIYTGTAIAPTIVNSEQQMLDTIKNNPNAIGYTSQEVSNEELHSTIVD
jgi:ABC-type phosphate transport system substrate-binding protein